MNTFTKKHIGTLVTDVNRLLAEGKYSDNGIVELVTRFNLLFEKRLKEDRTRDAGLLRMSNFGTTCERKLWYTANRNDISQPLMGHTRMKFLYGDIIEELVLSLAEEAGHSVIGRQDRMELYGVPGHRDAVIDGVTIDVKSANGRSFQKYKKNVEDIRSDIWFAPYYTQLQMYMEAAKDDSLVTSKNIGGFLAVDQEMGHITLQLAAKSPMDWEAKVEAKKKMLQAKEPPPRAFGDEPDGMSGNRKLCTYCSYCQFNKECWPGVRTFLYSDGPKHLTQVKRPPQVKEVT